MNQTLQTFSCPSCGAALTPAAGATTMKCAYCGSSVVIPDDLRQSAAAAPASQSPVSMDLGELFAKAIRMGEVVRLARSGDHADAVRLYQENTGVGQDQAEKIVQAIAHGQSIPIDPATRSAALEQIGEIREAAREMRDERQARRMRRRPGCAAQFIMLIVILVGVFAVTNPQFSSRALVAQLTSQVTSWISRFTPVPFAKPLLTFGASGTGAGMLADPRSVAVDPQGVIFTADYSDGRIQLFNPEGKFLSLISLGAKNPILGMVVDQHDRLYVSTGGEILVYNGSTGERLGKLNYTPDHDFSSLAIGPDNSLYAVSNGEDILRFDPTGKLTLKIPAAISSVSGDSELDTHLAVDGLGNIYALGTFNYGVFVYSPQGKYLNKFGGKGEGSGKFTSPEAVAVDGNGRVYVSDFGGVQVFDSDGAYQRTFSPAQGTVVFDMHFDTENNLYAVTNAPSVIKYQIQKP